MLYSFNFKHQLSENLNPRHSGGRHSTETRDSIIEGIREHEFEHYVRHSDALLSAREGFVYRAPSGHYVRQFLRVGNIQKSRQALDATFFWTTCRFWKTVAPLSLIHGLLVPLQ